MPNLLLLNIRVAHSSNSCFSIDAPCAVLLIPPSDLLSRMDRCDGMFVYALTEYSSCAAKQSRMWTIRLRKGDGTLFIILSFIFVAYILHPIVAKALARVRAHMGWVAIKHRRQSVEVTHYPLEAEVMGDRGNCNFARIATLLLALFSISSLGLELTMDLAFETGGPVDLLNRPPPVLERGENNDGKIWFITRMDNSTAIEGKRGNFKDTYSSGYAVGFYRVGRHGNVGIGDREVEGNAVISRWSNNFLTETTPDLYYNRKNHSVKGIDCTGDSLKNGTVQLDKDANHWGTATECVNGPALPSRSGVESPPTIILRNKNPHGSTYLVVEEDTSYPSFLYSVWRASGATTLLPVFYISSSYRLVEAIVTGIVNGVKTEGRDEITGGDCFALLTYWSLNNLDYPEGIRISPFGEHPDNNIGVVQHLNVVESIEAGVEVTSLTAVFGVVVLALSLGAIAGWLCSSSPVDIYNPYELISHLNLPTDKDGSVDSDLGKLRIFVEYVKNNHINVEVIKDIGRRNGWDRISFEAAELALCCSGFSQATSTNKMWLMPLKDLRGASDNELRAFTWNDGSARKLPGARRNGASDFSRLTKGRLFFPAQVTTDHEAEVGNTSHATASISP
ncbi:unnamed protein product [Choristocarpus tenellus]